MRIAYKEFCEYLVDMSGGQLYIEGDDKPWQDQIVKDAIKRSWDGANFARKTFREEFEELENSVDISAVVFDDNELRQHALAIVEELGDQAKYAGEGDVNFYLKRKELIDLADDPVAVLAVLEIVREETGADIVYDEDEDEDAGPDFAFFEEG